MNRIIPHIQFLLSQHDCVIIPGWGALVADEHSARIDGLTALPPRRTVGFNGSLDHNDGLLASSISRREGVTYQAAGKVVSDSVEMMKSVIELTGNFEIPRVGRFKRAAGGAILFTPDENRPLVNAPFYGLDALKLPVDNTIAENVAADNPRVLLRSVVKAVKWAAVIIVIFMLGVIFTTPVIFDKETHFQASIAKPVTKSVLLITPPREEPETVEIVAKPLPEKPKVKATVQPSTTVAPETSAESEKPVKTKEERSRRSAIPDDRRMNHDDQYFLIVGSFDTRQEAENWIAKRAWEKLDIIEYDGHHRVFAASGNTLKSVTQYKKQFAAIHPGTWVFCK